MCVCIYMYTHTLNVRNCASEDSSVYYAADIFSNTCNSNILHLIFLWIKDCVLVLKDISASQNYFYCHCIYF